MRSLIKFFALFSIAHGLTSCAADTAPVSEAPLRKTCEVELIVLGAGQDAAAPQIGNHSDPAWQDDLDSELLAASLAVVDHRNGARYLFEATPNIARQLKLLDDIVGQKKPSIDVSAIFITHAHIGHYAGLMFLSLIHI